MIPTKGRGVSVTFVKPEKILEHELVPRHEILKKKDAEKLLASRGIRTEQLPRILRNDPVVQVIKAKKGDVLKITRKSPTAGESVYYRLVT